LGYCGVRAFIFFNPFEKHQIKTIIFWKAPKLNIHMLTENAKISRRHNIPIDGIVFFIQRARTVDFQKSNNA
jgi:hypothetical protein